MKEELNLTLEDHQKAKVEVAFLLNILSQTIPYVVGKASGVVGLRAGQEAARKMPLFFESPDISSVMEGIQHFLEGGFDITSEIADEDIELTVGRCALREVCEIENLPLNGDLCKLFHDYMNGMITELAKRKFKMDILKTGDTCVIKHNAI